MSKKKKTYKKKYYTGGRVDMSKGGRVKAQTGGLKKAPEERKEKHIKVRGPVTHTVMGKPPAKNVGQPVPTPVTGKPPARNVGQPVKPPVSVSPTLPGVKIDPTLPSKGKRQPPMSVGGVGGGKEVPDEITSIERIPNEEDLERERLAEERRKAAEEAAAQAAQETREPASPEIMRETTPPDTTFTTTNEQGQQIKLPNMIDWEKQ